MVDWRKLEAAVDRKVGGAFGETVRLSFMANGKIDPDRPQIVIRCEALHTEDDTTRPAGNAASGPHRVRFAAADAVLFIDRSTYEGPALKTGDKVRAMDRAGEPVWLVDFVSDRHSNLIAVALKEL
ncbi:hypothetical protein [Agrobacterium pusense]|uniref:hypothetical protein n=1 Tax=Agrobacterium pusense TaxID=648995 RepID=UPI00156B1960|nr:hypothetical protein [Agrobacterium pusense]QKJ91601.1 hypothetical protein HQN82_09610 [Agrobacterium pusense]